jgi:uncharacterized protein (DUF305 family)
MPRLRPSRPPARPGWPHLLLLVVALGGLLLWAGRSLDAASPPSAAASTHAIDQWNPADTAFVQAMVLHRQQALQMANLVQGRTARPELLRLARRIQLAQDPEMAQLTARLRDRSPSVASGGVGDVSGGADGRWFDGMMAPPQLRTLAATTGPRFDFLFVDMLLAHHNGAVVMAGEALADGGDPQVGQFASSVLTGQQQEIGELTTWRRRWAEPFLRQLGQATARRAAGPPSI